MHRIYDTLKFNLPIFFLKLMLPFLIQSQHLIYFISFFLMVLLIKLFKSISFLIILVVWKGRYGATCVALWRRVVLCGDVRTKRIWRCMDDAFYDYWSIIMKENSRSHWKLAHFHDQNYFVILFCKFTVLNKKNKAGKE